MLHELIHKYVSNREGRSKVGRQRCSPVFAEPVPSCPCLFQPKAKDCPSSVTTTVWLLPAAALMILCLE